MAYSSGLFQGIPAVYAFLPRQQKRRTATNIMAGYFDPLPMLPPELERMADSSTRRTTPVSVVEKEQVPEGARPEPRRTGTKKGRFSAPKRARRKVPSSRVADGLTGKGKATKPVLPEEKENEEMAVSDEESSESLSPPPPSPGRVDADLVATRPKASGFWRARSSNASEVSSLKRKRSSLIPDEKRSSVIPDDRQSSPSAETPRSKKPRLSESGAVDTRSHIFYSTSPSLGSSGSLASSVSEPLEIEETMTDSYEGKAAATSFCAGVSENFSLQDDPKNKQAESQSAPALPLPKRARGVRKNVAVKKGWKGWVEEDLEPQKLILLDKPEVLPERTTRSGRKID